MISDELYFCGNPPEDFESGRAPLGKGPMLIECVPSPDNGLKLSVFARRIMGLRAARGDELSFDKALIVAENIARYENKKGH